MSAKLLRKVIGNIDQFPLSELEKLIGEGLHESDVYRTLLDSLPEGHVIVTSSEHNAVMRPLSEIDAHISRIPSDRSGFSLMEKARELITPETAAMIINAAGNVSGAVQDLEKAAEIASEHHIPLIIDAAQASPEVMIDMSALNAAAVCFTGHKGFLGPQGTGGAVSRRDIAEKITPLVAGGTGTESDNEGIPSSLPERLRGGTENLPGLIGLCHSVSYVSGCLESIRSRMIRSKSSFSALVRPVSPLSSISTSNPLSSR